MQFASLWTVLALIANNLCCVVSLPGSIPYEAPGCTAGRSESGQCAQGPSALMQSKLLSHSSQETLSRKTPTQVLDKAAVSPGPDTTFSALPSVRGPSGDSCNAEALLGFNEKYPMAGFGAKVNNFMNQLAWAALRNRTVAFWGHGHFVGTWASFFDTSLPSCEDWFGYHEGFEDEMMSFWQGLVTKDAEHALNVKRVTYSAHYRYTAATSDYIHQVLESYGLPNDYFGVHIRLGDKVFSEARPISIEAYGQAIQNSCEQSAANPQHSAAFSVLAQAREAAEHIKTSKDAGIRTVWLASLEPQAKDALQEILGEEYEIKRLTESVKDWQDSAAEQYAPGSQALYEVLTDVEALRRSHTFIGTASSNFGRLVYFLRQPGSNSISLDEDFLGRSG